MRCWRGADVLEPLIALADRLRAEGFDVSTSELIDATRAIGAIDIGDRGAMRDAMRATMIKQPDPFGRFDLAFGATFRVTAAPVAQDGLAADAVPWCAPGPPLDDEVLRALLDGDGSALAALAARAVQAYAGIDDIDGSERYFLHRVLRRIDLSRMLSAAMQQLRRNGEADELELMVQRTEIAAALDQLRRMLAEEIAARLRLRTEDVADLTAPADFDRPLPEDLDVLALSRAEVEQVQLALQPLLRRLAVRVGRRRRRRSRGRLDVRSTLRHSLQYGGVPIEPVHRRKHPHRPDIVVLCDVSGSVAEFAQFTFAIVHALHREVSDVRSFAFVDGVAEVSDVFAAARYEIAARRLVERRGVVGLLGHSDYGAVFESFRRTHLDDVVGAGTTLIITGDARGNHHGAGLGDFATIADRARRVHWLNPERRELWGEHDSLIEEYRQMCTTVHEVRTVNQLANVIGELL